MMTDSGSSPEDQDTLGDIHGRGGLDRGSMTAYPDIVKTMQTLNKYAGSLLKGVYTDLRVAVIEDINKAKELTGTAKPAAKPVEKPADQPTPPADQPAPPPTKPKEEPTVHQATDTDKIDPEKTVHVWSGSVGSYGMIDLSIPFKLTKGMKSQIERTLDQYFMSNHIKPAKSLKSERWKYFHELKGGQGGHTHTVQQEVLPDILDIFKDEGYHVVFHGPEIKSHTMEGGERHVPKLEILGVRNTQYGRQIAVSWPEGVSNLIRQQLQGENLWRNGIGWAGKEGNKPVYTIGVDKTGRYFNVNNLGRIVRKLAEHFDVSELIDIIKKEGITLPNEHASNIPLGSARSLLLDINDAPGNKLKIKVPAIAGMSYSQRKTIQQIISYTFPGAKQDSGDFTWTVEGGYNQYMLLAKLLDRYHWGSEGLRRIIQDKVDRGDLTHEDVEGNLPDNFLASIDQRLPNREEGLNLYDVQKEGVAHLYSRKSAILGDETGTGKTLQLIAAAELKMQDIGANAKTLVVTLKGVQQQFKNEILRVIGPQNEHLVSTDPMNPARWTVLYYDQLSAGKEENISERLRTIREAGFNIVMFDELHKLKHEDSKRTKNIAEATANIPIRWGASATISSNIPFDVKNQLFVVGHHLGKIDRNTFKTDFAGMERKEVEEGSKKAYGRGAKVRQVRAAENLNKWLHLTGLYIRRTKKDVRDDMPNLSVQTNQFNFEPHENDAFNDRMKLHLARVKAPNNPGVFLQVAREELALTKVPKTIARARELVQQGRRIVIFTNFRSSGRELVSGLTKMLQEIDPNYKVMTYNSDTPAKDLPQVKRRFTEEQDYRVLVMSMKMGGTGIDFPNAAQNMIINDFDWTPENSAQSEGRIYRVTTNHPVHIDYMVAQGTIDQRLYDMLQQKRELARIIERYRKDYQDDIDPQAAMDHLIRARLEMDRLNGAIHDVAVQTAREHGIELKAEESKKKKTKDSGDTEGKNEGLTFGKYMKFVEDNDWEDYYSLDEYDPWEEDVKFYGPMARV